MSVRPEDILNTLPPEELAKIKPPTKEELEAAFAEGFRARAAALMYPICHRSTGLRFR